MLSLRLPWARRAGDRTVVRNALSSNAQSIDVALLWVVGTLLAIGLVMVYSASIALPDSPKFAAYKPTHFLMRHAFSIALAIPVGLIVFATPMRFWQRWAPLLFLAWLVLLVIVLMKFTPVIRDDWWQQSRLLPTFERSASWMTTLLPEAVAKYLEPATAGIPAAAAKVIQQTAPVAQDPPQPSPSQ